MHIKRGVYLGVMKRLSDKSYSRWLQFAFIGLVCCAVLLSGIFMLKNTFAAPPCPCSVFSSSDPASQPGLYNQTGGIEVGFKFQVDQPGYISGVRFYKVAGMSGTHTASVWDSVGNQLATAIFTSESAAGWQEVDFAPIAVTANAIYTASVHMDDGNYVATPAYFTSTIHNAPLTVPANGYAGDGKGYAGQGVFNTSPTSAYPNSSFNSNNYWIDTVYISSPNANAPTVTAKSPAADATNVTVSDAVTATFDKQLLPSTLTTSTVLLKDQQGTIVPGVVSYDATTSTVKFIPNVILKVNTTYTATLKGGTGNVISDYDGHNLGADYAWSFTTSAAQLSCPCSLKGNQAPTTANTYRETYPSGLEVGTKIVPSANGYITALRFYKPIISQQTSHIGHIWSSDGANLATVTFANESDYGWQEATLSSPVYVTKDSAYIMSYGMTSTNYVVTQNGLSAALVSPGFAVYPSGDSRNMALGSGTTSAVYTTTAGAYPSSPASNNQDYWIDAVFSLQPNEALPLGVVQTQPSANSYGVKADSTFTASFDQALDPTSVTAGTLSMRDATGRSVAGQTSYDATKHAVVFTPSTNLAANTQYTVTLTTGITDVRGLHPTKNYTASFTVGSSPAVNLTQGNGGPVLVATTATDNYGKYYAEILRTEGFNYFDVRDISTLTPAILNNYKAIILAQSSISQAQVDMLQSWVTSGGNLIAMRPDKKLAGLLGLTDAGNTTSNAYLKVNTATKPGLGIVSNTIQYKGTADQYQLHGATAVAQLYSDAATATPYPAVTTQVAGAGTAMSFTYDLARSVIALHQGNQAWAGQDRTGAGVPRIYDLFYGSKVGDIQPDWLDSNKMDIPQADEQQRLLANLLTISLSSHLPAPRFWYLPNNQKAALVLAGDDHGLSNEDGTEQQLDHLLNISSTSCSVMDWGCARATHYIYDTSALTNTRAVQFTSDGFEIGDHPSAFDGSCNPPSSLSALNTLYVNKLTTWRAKYTGVPNQQTSRFHCYLWPSWDWMPQAEVNNNIHYDLNAVAYPSSWIGTHSPMITGSGMNMHLTDTTGNLIDVRQGVTNFDNTTSSATSIAAMLDNALGTNGYYGIFGSHYDMSDTYNSTLYALASSRNVPVITAQQALTWLDGRSASNFNNLTSSQTGRVNFSIATAEGAYGLQAMMPLQDGGGTLAAIQYAGQTISYTTSIVKGVVYAIFDALPGSYTVTYSDFNASMGGENSTNDTSANLNRSSQKATSGVNPDDTTTTQSTTSNTTHSSPLTARSAIKTKPVLSHPVTPQPWWQAPATIMTAGSVIVAAGGGVSYALITRRRSM